MDGGLNMGLDITIYEKEPVICPCCRAIVKYDTVDEAISSGKDWYDFLENIGYYIPYEKQSDKEAVNSWYGKDMELSLEQVTNMVKFVRQHKVYNYYEIEQLVRNTKLEGHLIVINADW